MCVAAYTGILLMSAPGVPLWNTLLLPCLFTVSALDTGVALVELVERGVERKAVSPRLSGKAHKLQSRVVCVLVVAELLVLAAFLSDACWRIIATGHATQSLLAERCVVRRRLEDRLLFIASKVRTARVLSARLRKGLRAFRVRISRQITLLTMLGALETSR